MLWMLWILSAVVGWCLGYLARLFVNQWIEQKRFWKKVSEDFARRDKEHTKWMLKQIEDSFKEEPLKSMAIKWLEKNDTNCKKLD